MSELPNSAEVKKKFRAKGAGRVPVSSGKSDDLGFYYRLAGG